ncbi:hypothetical protein EJ02DRAFT_427110 [Clathrospora elynae]|uniref:Uncharacterized protein n=1 Tax=Clathrospora elynae TaxID=706981 RepID=A0A6A5SB22_9PLEO|nr:hypothetical protein EJ02DRAFT_427110 [Clathrospora elynae]
MSLLKLVIDNLAQSIGLELFKHLKDLIGHNMALQLLEAMIERQQVKTELYDQAIFKSESEETATDAQQPAHIG